jgi:hypothetical protein
MTGSKGWQQVPLADLGREVRESLRPEPGTWYELFSVPIFAAGRPEVVDGRDIGSTKRIVQPADVLICKINPRINRVWTVPAPLGVGPQIASSEYLVFRPDQRILSGFLTWYLRSPGFRDWIKLSVEGATGSHTRAKSGPILRQLVPVPPLNEQQRIVSAIEEQYSCVDGGEATVRHLIARCASLKKRILFGVGTASDTDAPSAPVSAVLKTVSDEGRKVQARSYKHSGSLPVVDQGEGLVGGYTDDESKAYEGPLPVLVFGDHTRRVKLIDFPFAVGADGVKLLAPAPGVDARYAAFALQGLPLSDRGYARHFALLRREHICLPTLEKQVAIADAVEIQLARIDRLLSALRECTSKCRALRRVILRDALAGRLTR